MDFRKCASFPPARVCLALTVAMGLGACADAPTGTIEPALHASISLRAPTPSDAQTLARGLALAMRDPSIRGDVHNAMRASRFNEHKLVLQDLLNGPEGKKLLTAISAGLGQTPSSIKNAVANLPALDFYLPFMTQRQSWKSTADVYVATTFDPDAAAIIAYGSNGRTLTLRKDQGVPTVPLMILHPAEPKVTNNAPLATSVAEVIESPTESRAASNSVSSPPSSGSFSILPGGGGGGGGGGGPAPGTYINHFNIKQDDGWFGNSEMRFYSFAEVGWEFHQGLNGTSWFLIANHECAKGTYSQDGVDTSGGYDGLFPISPTVTRGSGILTCDGLQAQYAIHIMEADGGLNGDDDDYGWRIYAGGGYPSGAMYDPVVNSFYVETFPNGLYLPLDDGHRSAYLRIIVY